MRFVISDCKNRNYELQITKRAAQPLQGFSSLPTADSRLPPSIAFCFLPVSSSGGAAEFSPWREPWENETSNIRKPRGGAQELFVGGANFAVCEMCAVSRKLEIYELLPDARTLQMPWRRPVATAGLAAGHAQSPKQPLAGSITNRYDGRIFDSSLD